MTMTYTLTVREPAISVNEKGGGVGQNHFEVGKRKKAMEGLYLTELMVARVRKGMQFVNVDITLEWARRAHRDEENFRHPVVKPFCDALQKGGYIADDTADWVKIRSLEFAHPKPWPYHPWLKGVQVITLEAVYA